MFDTPVAATVTKPVSSKFMSSLSPTPSRMNPQAIKVACSNCNLRELCMPVGLPATELERLDELVATRRKVPRGAALFRKRQENTPGIPPPLRGQHTDFGPLK